MEPNTAKTEPSNVGKNTHGSAEELNSFDWKSEELSELQTIKTREYELQLKNKSTQTELWEIMTTPFHLMIENGFAMIIMGNTMMDKIDDTGNAKHILVKKWIKPTWMQITKVMMKIYDHMRKEEIDAMEQLEEQLKK